MLFGYSASITNLMVYFGILICLANISKSFYFINANLSSPYLFLVRREGCTEVLVTLDSMPSIAKLAWQWKRPDILSFQLIALGWPWCLFGLLCSKNLQSWEKEWRRKISIWRCVSSNQRNL